jgi:hypothetical protein
LAVALIVVAAAVWEQDWLEEYRLLNAKEIRLDDNRWLVVNSRQKTHDGRYLFTGEIEPKRP